MIQIDDITYEFKKYDVPQIGDYYITNLGYVARASTGLVQSVRVILEKVSCNTHL